MTTNGHIPRHRQYALSLKQRAAIDLLLAGKNDREVAAQLGADRSTVTKWRLYDPQFQTALDRRRALLWPAAADHARALLPTALATMDEQLRVGPNRGRLALDYIFRAGLLGKPYSGAIATAGIGPTSMEQAIDLEVLRHRTAARRAAHPDASAPEDEDAAAAGPITEEERDAAFHRLLARRDHPDPEDPEDPEDPAVAGDTASPTAPADSGPPAASVSASTRSMSSFR